MARDSVGGTFLVASVLCIVCSLVVSTAAVMLRPLQEANRRLDKQKNILIAAGLLTEGMKAEEITATYKASVTRLLINLETGQEADPAVVNPETFDPKAAAKNASLNAAIIPKSALNGIKKRSKYAFVYLITENDKVTQTVFPIHGNGLWSTLYGFISLDTDNTTIRGITFYAHGETPGLGAEVDNRVWKEQWRGKKAFDAAGEVQIRVIKGSVDAKSPAADHQVDGLSGATLTSNGVTGLIKYWLGENGFGPYLSQTAQGVDRG